jgi:hypothetical protein
MKRGTHSRRQRRRQRRWQWWWPWWWCTTPLQLGGCDGSAYRPTSKAHSCRLRPKHNPLPPCCLFALDAPVTTKILDAFWIAAATAPPPKSSRASMRWRTGRSRLARILTASCGGSPLIMGRRASSKTSVPIGRCSSRLELTVRSSVKWSRPRSRSAAYSFTGLMWDARRASDAASAAGPTALISSADCCGANPSVSRIWTCVRELSLNLVTTARKSMLERNTVATTIKRRSRQLTAICTPQSQDKFLFLRCIAKWISGFILE